MKTLTAFLLGLLALALANPVALAAPPDSWAGVWRNTRNTVHIRVSPCGEAVCGTVVWAADQAKADARRGSGHDLIGTQLLRGFHRSDDGSWRGQLYIPDIDSKASATVTFVTADLILVSGCAFLGIACKSQHWHRIG
ncbi:MAG: DUF2147 domain-containing protein [Sphingomonas sp.]